MQAAKTSTAQTAEAEIKKGANLSLRQRWIDYLQERIDGSSLAVFRICFGVAMVVNVWIYASTISMQYVDPLLNFPLIPGLQPLPGNVTYALFAVTAFSGACVAMGLWYRVATIVLFASFTCELALDASYYQNHFYLCSLLALLFCIIPANNTWSLDKPRTGCAGTVPRWALATLKAQIFIVYFFGGIAKLNYDWLVRQQPLIRYLKETASRDPW
ncbi:MAG: HTTM domain-containing protein, partial [Terriglobales bacterium]